MVLVFNRIKVRSHMSRITSIKEEQEFEAFIGALFNQNHPEKVRKELERVRVPSPYRIRIKVLYSQNSIIKVIDSLVDKGNLQYIKKESKTYSYHTRIGRKHSNEIKIPFFVDTFEKYNLNDNVQAIVTICKTDQWDTLRKFITKNYPRLVPILLSQQELIESSRSLRTVSGHSLTVKAYTAKETFNDTKSKIKKSIRTWTAEELDKVLHSVRDRMQTLTTIDIEFFQLIDNKPHILPSAICKIRKNGEIEVTGNYQLAFDAVASRIAEEGFKKLDFFSGRGMRSSEYKPRPVAINFALPVFETIETIREFVEILSKYPRSMYAVEHGNPYAHVKLTDIYDGSSFDIWAISPSSIALMPGLKATEAAFERLSDYIYGQFREGKIEEYGSGGSPKG